MRYFIVVLLLLLSFSQVKAEEDFLGPEYNFIDTAFQGIKPVTDKQFNDTINKMTPQPVENTFGSRLKTFLFGRKYGVEPAPIIKDDIDTGADLKAIQDLTHGVYYIRLTASIIGENGNIIPLGNYKITEKIINNQPMLVFYQGRDEYGKLRLMKYEDNLKNENDIAYTRVDIVSDDLIRIVYATISDTKCALGRVYLQN